MYLIKKKKSKIREDLWDFEDKDELIYWRKSNQIHKYFCDYGEEIEEQREYIISKKNIEDLLSLCKEIKEKVILKEGKIQIGQRLTENGWEPILGDGKYISNPEICEELLPTTSGFFFGSTDYDEYYLNDIEYTKNKIELILKTLDFDKYDLVYLASW